MEANDENDESEDYGINPSYCCCAECVRALGELLNGPPQTWDGSKYATYGDLMKKEQ